MGCSQIQHGHFLLYSHNNYLLKFQKKALILLTGFDLTTRDSYFTILVEVFTNHISAENRYFTNHIEWTEHKIMGFKPSNRYQIIWQYFLSTIFIIIHFFVKQKLCKHYIFYGAEHNELQRGDS